MAGLVPVAVSAFVGFIAGLIVIVLGMWKFGKSLDKRWSVTQVQLILWTGVVLGSYLALSMSAGSFLSNVPTYTLVLIGIASGTLAFTSITNGLQGKGDGTTGDPPSDPKDEFMGGFLATERDPKQPSLIKAQMFAWNIVAILLFVTFVGSNLYNGNYSLPDVGATLGTIIAISNGAHVAAKPVDKKKGG